MWFCRWKTCEVLGRYQFVERSLLVGDVLKPDLTAAGHFRHSKNLIIWTLLQSLSAPYGVWGASMYANEIE